MRLTMFAAALALLAAPALAQTTQPSQPATQPAQLSNPRSGQPTTAAAPLPTGAAPAHRRRTMQERFDAANTTHDGHLTLEQARAGRLNAVVRDFSAIDTAKRGYVTLDDIKAHRRAVRQAKKAATPK
ncbi:MAG: hypothetical protein ACRYHQ_24690 [Janthinobacterium lividum]